MIEPRSGDISALATFEMSPLRGLRSGRTFAQGSRLGLRRYRRSTAGNETSRQCDGVPQRLHL